ncbi:MAG TPA: hypothetical protein VGM23_16065 [Armatimonadota bacterium]
MLHRIGMILAVAILLVVPPAWTADPAKNTPPPPFCVHESRVDTWLVRTGRASSVIHTEMWSKAPEKYFIENENYIQVSNEREGWFYRKTDHTYRVGKNHGPTADYYTADYRILCARKNYNNVEVKESPGEVTITYKSRDATPCILSEHITLVDAKSRMMKIQNIESVVPDGPFVNHRLTATFDYALITDESIFYRSRPADAKPEQAPAK